MRDIIEKSDYNWICRVKIFAIFVSLKIGVHWSTCFSLQILVYRNNCTHAV